ncbi:glycosyltransferase family 4 protein [Rasiella rasia]|uniref:Glycosyltransferase family 4 protein n=1 Tax=Rasiella rasia TaxID=2744027 RepID=A0A6G6GQ11_9FLAO|nr:glycosyltransferase family 4 protein [Rasiella rasia]QIE60627.1 glycosyltransferase family 4 protein [Rasiella rasia]
MRIGIVLSQTPGYSETFFTSKIKGLQAAGFSVVLYTQNKAADFALCQVKTAPKVRRFLPIQLLVMAGTFISLIPKLAVVLRFIKAEKRQGSSMGAIYKKIFLNAHLLKAKLDWLHFGFATIALGSEQVAEAIGAKMAVSFRGFDINVYPLKHPGCYNLLWTKVNRVHSISKYLHTKAISFGLSSKTPFEIITPAVDLEALPKSVALTNKTMQILTIARLTWIKGIETAITAMRLLKERGVRFQYHIVGDGSTKDTERYTFQVYEHGLTDCVFFHGKLTHQETLQHLNKADIYVQPSLNEGFCNAVLEAQAMGKLTIASHVGGLPENIVDQKTGWLFPSENAEALATKIQEVIAFPKTEIANISAAARKRIQDDFSVKQQQEKFVSFYKNNR